MFCLFVYNGVRQRKKTPIHQSKTIEGGKGLNNSMFHSQDPVPIFNWAFENQLIASGILTQSSSRKKLLAATKGPQQNFRYSYMTDTRHTNIYIFNIPAFVLFGLMLTTVVGEETTAAAAETTAAAGTYIFTNTLCILIIK